MKKAELLNGTITEVQKSHYTVFSDNKYIKAEVSGRFSYIASEQSDYPVIGDEVLFRIVDQYFGIIERVKTRKSYISRMSTASTKHEEVLAANIDIAFICVSLNNDFNVKKIERLISLVSHPFIKPILILTKKDLTENLDSFLTKIQHIDIQKLAISSFCKEDVEYLRTLIGTDTIVCLGASGVGKSTLVNQLIGQTYFKTSGIRESDDQGHHTTTHKEMIMLDSGGAIIDTPGIRVITSYIVNDVENRFKSIFKYGKDCRFRDCSHTHEPGCAVLAAIENQELSQSDYEEYLRMQRYNRFIASRNKANKR